MGSETGYTGPLVAFDLDDTLYKEADFLESGFTAVADKVSEEYGLNPRSVFEDMRAAWHRGDNAFDMLADMLEPADRNHFIAEAVSIYRYHNPDIKLSEGAHELLTALSKKGIRQALVTDGRSKTQRAKIRALDVSEFFAPENIMISEEVGAEKRNSKVWRELVRRYPNASRFIYVGDNPAKDFIMPHKMGWVTIGIADSGRNIHSQQTGTEAECREPDVWVKDMQELGEALKKYF